MRAGHDRSWVRPRACPDHHWPASPVGSWYLDGIAEHATDRRSDRRRARGTRAGERDSDPAGRSGLAEGLSMNESVPFDEQFRARLRDLFVWRRDVRRFRRDPLPPGTLERLIEAACLSPSVGLSQPWRFVIVDDPARRQAVLDAFKGCNADALASYAGELAAKYAKLKLAGLEEAPCQLAVFADCQTEVGHGLGRKTMPEMAEYSVV